MPAPWLIVLSWMALVAGITCAAEIVYDVAGRGYRQKMRVMEVVWPVTALYFGPVATWGYRRFGRPKTHRWRVEHCRDAPPDAPTWATVATGVSHCGAGCTLGDIVAEFSVFGLGAAIAGEALFAEMTADYVAALALGIVFQYFAIAPMRGLG